MERQRDHFVFEDTCLFKGECQEFISAREQQWRNVDRLEKHPFRRVSAYTRNIQYEPSNTRTFTTLKEVLAYLIDNIFPILFDHTKSPEQKEHVVLFLEERLVAIRCQYFVQGIICPKELLRLLRCFIITDIMKGVGSGSRTLVGLQFLVQTQSKSIMAKEFQSQYLEALKYGIISSKIKNIQNFIFMHPIILDNSDLYRLLLMKVKIEQNNFDVYFDSLQHQEPIVRCLLWLQIESVKDNLTSIVKKSFGDVPADWLFKRLCLNQKDSEKWINLKKTPKMVQSDEIDFKCWLSDQTFRGLLT